MKKFSDYLNEVTQDSQIKDEPGTQPAKYYVGLSKEEKEKRDKVFKQRAKMSDDDPDAYKPAPGDEDVVTKESPYTKKYHQEYNEADEKEAIKNKAKETGYPYEILKKVFDRGMAAWKSGHRPGTNPFQWGMARINSFVTDGKTTKTADKDLYDKVKNK